MTLKGFRRKIISLWIILLTSIFPTRVGSRTIMNNIRDTHEKKAFRGKEYDEIWPNRCVDRFWGFSEPANQLRKVFSNFATTLDAVFTPAYQFIRIPLTFIFFMRTTMILGRAEFKINIWIIYTFGFGSIIHSWAQLIGILIYEIDE